MGGEGKHSHITRVPLEDVTELWYWGMWKEPLPSEFDTTTAVICTSRKACLRYYGNRTNDLWLAVEEGMMDTQDAEKELRREAVFDESSKPRQNAVFKRLTYTQLIEAVIEDLSHQWHASVLINPRRNPKSKELEFDAAFTGSAFLEAVGVEPRPEEKVEIAEAPVVPVARRRRR